MKKSYLLLSLITGILQAQPDFEEQIDTTCAGGWNDSWMDLGAIEIDDSSQCMLFVENQGYDDLILSNIHIGESQNDNPNTAFSVTVDSLVIPPEGLDSIVVYFYPEDVGFYSGSLSFETNDDSSPMHNEALHGTGLSPVREIYIYTDFDSDTIYYYDAELGDTDYIEYLYITNLGNTELEIDDIVATEPFYVDINDVSLGTLEWLEIPIEFIPEINGEYFGTVTIYSNDSDESELIVHLVGTTQDDCTADDGTAGVELWGECYSIDNTTELNLSNIGLTGTIPPEIGNLTNLTILNLGDNQLTGVIPQEIWNLTNLNILNLRSNELTGTISSEIENLTNLTHFTLRHNQLTGTIPPEIGNLTNLTVLNFRNNELTGAIPQEIWNLTNLNILNLRSNELTGSISPDIGNLVSLTYLNFGYNQLTGDICPEIGNLTNLTELNLVYNQLTGIIPDEICNQGDSSPSLFNNQLCPPYPECVEEYVGDQDTTNCEQVSIIDETLHLTYALYNAYPNPFNPVTTLRYDLPEDALVNITIYDMMGRVVSNLVSSQQNAGYKSIQWNATNNQGEPVSAGVYLYKVQTGDFVDTKKMILLK